MTDSIWADLRGVSLWRRQCLALMQTLRAQVVSICFEVWRLAVRESFRAAGLDIDLFGRSPPPSSGSPTSGATEATGRVLQLAALPPQAAVALQDAPFSRPVPSCYRALLGTQGLAPLAGLQHLLQVRHVLRHDSALAALAFRSVSAIVQAQLKDAKSSWLEQEAVRVQAAVLRGDYRPLWRLIRRLTV